jgi:hypothetical protein
MLCALLIAAFPALASAAPASPPAAGTGAAAHGANAPATPTGGAADAQPQPGKKDEAASCDIKPLPVVEAAYREVPAPARKGSGAPSATDAEATTSQDLQLDDVLTVKIPKLSDLMAQLATSCKGKKLVLYLDGRPIPDLVAYSPTGPENAQQVLYFTLTPTSASRDAWAHVLGNPGWERRPTAVSVGLADGFAFPSDPPAVIQLAVIPHGRFIWWALLFGAILIAFFVLAAKSDVMRDAGPPPGGGARRPFSLSRSQAAWWFFIILGSYLLIGLVTGNVLSSITGSVLVLLGISAGTVVGAAAVDAGQQKPDSQARKADAQAQLTVQVAQAGANLQAVQAAHGAQAAQVAQAAQAVQAAQAAATAAAGPAAAQAAEAAKVAHAVQIARAAQTAAAVTAATAALTEKQSQLKAARNETENFFLDILSDADGVSFHRFQNAAWTVVMGIIFACQVYRDLAMPQFDGSLLALMGISAGTYLGMKIPEPKVPTITP